MAIGWLAKLNLLLSCSDMIFRSLPNPSKNLYIYINISKIQRKSQWSEIIYELFELISSKVKYFTHLQDILDISNSLGRFLQISLP